MHNYKTHIKAKTGWRDINVREILHYRDLILLFYKRNYITRYKQTILGPLWLVINPLISVTLYVTIFGSIAGLSTDGAPMYAFYMCGNAIWSFFATCITTISSTFISNAGIMGKVYFPRIIMPISSVIAAGMDLLIQLLMIAVVFFIYAINGIYIYPSMLIFVVPLIVIQVGLLGMGCGIVIAALTTKYRDLIILVSFGLQLWMYISPMVYSISEIPEKYYNIYMLNPMAPVITTWRFLILGVGRVDWFFWGISWVTTVVVLIGGVMLFSQVERTFMDTV